MDLNVAPMLWLVGFQMGLYAIAWFLCGLMLKEDRDAVAHWAAFLVLIGITLLLAGSRGEPREWVYYNGANVISILAFVLVSRGVTRFMRVPTRDLETAIVLVGGAGTVALLGPDESRASLRVILSYACQGYVMARAMWDVRTAVRLEFGRKTLFAIVAPGVAIGVMLVLVALRQVLDYAHPMEMHDDTLGNYGLMYYYLAGTAIFNFGFMVLLTQRLIVKLQDSSRRDALTSLFNRRALDEELQRTWHRYRRNRESFAVLLADIDHFKQVNDTHGHAAGDRVLRTLADLLIAHARGTDIVGRIGGEEFVLVLPHAQRHEAERSAERLRHLVEAQDIRAGAHAMRITVSIGIGCVQPGDDAIDTVIARADRALYRAKEAGRNRVAVESAPAPEPAPLARVVNG